MKHSYLSRRQKEALVQNTQEELLIENSVYKPNECISFKDRAFRIGYALVKDGTLHYLLHGKKSSYFVPESALVTSDQI